MQSLQSRTTGSNGIQSNALTVKIVDFGIAALAVAPAETQKLTALGTIFGSPLYMSPEQSMGQLVGESSDIYSCGCALFQALTGKPPFVGSNALTTLLMHQSSPIPSLKSSMNGRACPHALEELVTTMLAKSPENRYQNVEEVLDYLLHIGKMNEVVLEDSQGEQNQDDRRTRDEAEEEEEKEENHENEDEEDEGDGEHASRNSSTIVTLCAALVSTLSIFLIAYLYFASNTRQALVESKTKPTIVEPIPRPRAKPALAQVSENLPDEKYFPDIQMTKLERRLASPTHDKRLVVSQFAKLSDQTIERIANTSWIRNLTISRCDFNNQSLGKLTKLNLIRINLEHTKFNDQGAKSLSHCQTLREIKAQSTDVTNDGLKELSSIKDLRILRLSKTIVNADGIRELCKRNRNCTTIYLADCRNITLVDIGKLRHEFPKVNFITDMNTP